MVNFLTVVEAPQDAGGLPQLDTSTYEAQAVWLVITFAFLYFVVSKVALPRIGATLVNREETIADDLDTAERRKREAEEMKVAYEASLEEARREAHNTTISNKEKIVSEVADAQHKLDEKLGKKQDKAEAAIAKAVDDALAGLDALATDVASDLVSKLSSKKADEKAVKTAVKSAMKGA